MIYLLIGIYILLWAIAFNNEFIYLRYKDILLHVFILYGSYIILYIIYEMSVIEKEYRK